MECEFDVARHGAQTTQDSLGRSKGLGAPWTFRCLLRRDAHLSASRRFCRSDAGRGAKDAEFRDRSAFDMCPITTLRGLLL